MSWITVVGRHQGRTAAKHSVRFSGDVLDNRRGATAGQDSTPPARPRHAKRLHPSPEPERHTRLTAARRAPANAKLRTLRKKRPTASTAIGTRAREGSLGRP